MNIEQARTAQVSRTYGARALRRVLGYSIPPGARAPQRADSASFSPEPQALLKAQRALTIGAAAGAGAAQKGTAVRTELVAQLRQQVQDGTYRVDESSLARKIAQRLKSDEV